MEEDSHFENVPGMNEGGNMNILDEINEGGNGKGFGKYAEVWYKYILTYNL